MMCFLSVTIENEMNVLTIKIRVSKWLMISPENNLVDHLEILKELFPQLNMFEASFNHNIMNALNGKKRRRKNLRTLIES